MNRNLLHKATSDFARTLTATTMLFFMSLPGLAAGIAATAFPSTGQTVYVPAYSHIYMGDRQQPFYLTATVSVRNTDPSGTIVVHSVDYYGSSGTLIKRFVPRALLLRPLGSLRFIVNESDKSGGSGASFLVQWSSSSPVSQPLIETIMIGTGMQQGISFTSRGQAVREEPQQSSRP
ncbi:MAG: DUF3124 domain-containing protein [Chlorobiaceae bacterium]|nr:DUF3124 domain-containing protein [Chlorobiaceae bacterium]